MEKHKSLKLLSFLLSTFIVFSSLSGVVGADEMSIGNNNSSSPRIEDYESPRADNNDQIIATADPDKSITNDASPAASPEDIALEKGLFGNRAAFFEEVYNLKPVIRQKRSI